MTALACRAIYIQLGNVYTDIYIYISIFADLPLLFECKKMFPKIAAVFRLQGAAVIDGCDCNTSKAQQLLRACFF